MSSIVKAFLMMLLVSVVGTVAVGVATGGFVGYGMDWSIFASVLLQIGLVLLITGVSIRFGAPEVGLRVGLFLLLNIAVVISISVVVHLLGGDRYLTAYGMDYKALAIFCLVWGMMGSGISLAFSRQFAKFAMGVTVIQPEAPGSEINQWLVQQVHTAARAAGLPAMPEVGIFESEQVNAFATGPTKSRSLVAFSSGLLQHMSREEIIGVIGHEIAHITSGDMVTMTLLQGLVNAFTMFASRFLAYGVQKALKTESKWPYYLTQVLSEIVLVILGALIVCKFSRMREFRADARGAKLVGKDKMLATLRALDRSHSGVPAAADGEAIAALMISSPPRWLKLFSTHPPMNERIASVEMLPVAA